MKTTKTIIFPALLALSLFGAAHAYAGVDGDKNGEPPTDTSPDTGNGGDVDNNGGGDPGTGGGGGGDHVDKGGGNPDPGPEPEPEHHTKVDPPTPDPTPTPTPRPDPRPRPDVTNTDTDKKHTKRLVCVIGDQRFYVRYRSQCVGPRVVYRDPGVIYTQPRKRVRTVRYAAPCNCGAPVVAYGQGRGDIVIGGGYATSGTRFIGSPAAVAKPASAPTANCNTAVDTHMVADTLSVAAMATVMAVAITSRLRSCAARQSACAACAFRPITPTPSMTPAWWSITAQRS